jgi:putative Ca2+/H+ antiporter (TMEM165/GDT1 family)
LPEYVVSATVAILFAIFGIHALRADDDDDEEEIEEKSGHGIFFTTFVLLTVAEFGDKTQLAVVALSSVHVPAAVWLGATLALAATSAWELWRGAPSCKGFHWPCCTGSAAPSFWSSRWFAAYQAYVAYTGV